MIRFNCVTKVTSALRTGSSASKLGVVVDSGKVRMVIISLTTCRRKLPNFISGNGTVVGKKVTVTQSLIVLIRGKYHLTQW